MEKYRAKDPVMTRIREIVRNYEFNEENPCAIRLKETLGVCHVLKGLEQASKTDVETVSKPSRPRHVVRHLESIEVTE